AQWRLAALELHVGGRRTELTRQFLPMQYTAAESVGAPQQAPGQLQLAGLQSLTHAGAADTFAIQLDSQRGFDRKRVLLASTHEKVEIATATGAETEVVTDLQVFHPQPVDQHLMDELVSRQLAQAAIEGQAQHPIDTLAGEQLELLAQTCQACRRGVRGKELARLRLEDHHAARHSQFDGPLAQASQNGLMATVHTIEIADGGNASLGQG